MIRRLALIGTLMAAAFGAPAASALLVNAGPAWNGWVRAAAPSEVTVHVVSERGGPLSLTLTDQSTSYTHTTKLAPDTAYVWRVPVAAPAGDSLRIHAELAGEAAVGEDIALRRHLLPAPLVAVLSDQPVPLAAGRATTIHVPGEAMPFYGSSYAASDVTVIHRDVLRGRTREQLAALRQHAAACGRIVIVGLTPAEMAGFSDFAGCGGRFIAAAETPVDLEARVAGLLAAPVARLPSPGSLHTLLENHGMTRQVNSLAVFLAGYLLVLLFAVRSRRAPRYFFSASVVATVLALVAWRVSPEYTERVVWAEMENHAAAARFTSLLRVVGSGAEVSIDIPRDTHTIRPLQPSKLSFESGDGGDIATARFDARLFSRHEFMTSGVTAVQAPLAAVLAGDGPRVINPGPGASPPALLAWNDRKYTVPALAPDEVWQPSAEPEPWAANGAEQLFRQRAMRDEAALLLRNPAALPPPGNAAQSFLVVRP